MLDISTQPNEAKGHSRFSRRHGSHPADVDAVACALKNGLSGSGELIEAYEVALKAWFGAKHAIAVSSGSAAVMTALAATDVRVGQEVVMNPTAPLCTAYPVLAHGGTPVFCDTPPNNLGLDLDDLIRVVGRRTGAIIDAPMWGYPTHAEALRDLARELGKPLILDLAHGHGVRIADRHLWTYGDIACFSTHESKIISTGEGGFLLTDDARLADRARAFRQYGDLHGHRRGLNLKLGGLQAALGVARLARLSDDLAMRRSNAARLRGAISGPGLREFPVVASGEPNYFVLLVQKVDGAAAPLIDHMYSFGIPSDLRRYPCRPLYEFQLLRDQKRPTPQAAEVLASITTIPVHSDLGESELSTLEGALLEFQSRRGGTKQ